MTNQQETKPRSRNNHLEAWQFTKAVGEISKCQRKHKPVTVYESGVTYQHIGYHISFLILISYETFWNWQYFKYCAVENSHISGKFVSSFLSAALLAVREHSAKMYKDHDLNGLCWLAHGRIHCAAKRPSLLLSLVCCRLPSRRGIGFVPRRCVPMGLEGSNLHYRDFNISVCQHPNRPQTPCQSSYASPRVVWVPIQVVSLRCGAQSRQFICATMQRLVILS